MQQVKRLFRNLTWREAEAEVHVEPARNAQQSINYAQKEESRISGPYKGGSHPEKVAYNATNQGKRSDLAAAADMLLEGRQVWEVAELFPTQFVRYHGGMQKLWALQQQKARQAKVAVSLAAMEGQEEQNVSKPTVTILWGRTGVGKTLKVWREHGARQVYSPMCQHGKLWFEDYMGQEVLLLDDFDPTTIPLKLLLNILDRYVCQVPVKGGSMCCDFKYIYFTSNDDPQTWYAAEWAANPQHRDAFFRRVDKVSHLQ